MSQAPPEGPTHAGIAVQAGDTGRILMQQRAMDPEDPPEVQGTWEFPGGSLEDGEDPLEGAWREWMEETGLDQPPHEVTGGWRSPDGVYQGHVATIPTEDSLGINRHADGNGQVNPDDPERDHPEVAAWFTIEHVQDMGSAIRPEVLASTDWDQFAPTMTQDEGADMTETAQTAARPWFGVLAPEGAKSGDKRMFSDGALRMRTLPLPLTWQKISGAGHDGNIVTAIIQEVWRDNGLIWGSGEYLDTPEADEHFNLVDKFGRYGVSIDADDLDEFAIEMDEDGTTIFTDARVCSACAVSIPAFAEAWMMNGNYADFAADFAGGWGAPSQQIPTKGEAPAEPPPDCSCDENDDNYDPNCKCDESEVPAEDVTTPDDVPAALERYLAAKAESEKFGQIILVPEGWASEVFRDVPADERDKRAKDGTAMPDGSFPIANCEDLKNAIQAIGRAKDPEKAKAHIRKRKSALNCSDVDLPDTWATDDTEALKAAFKEAAQSGGTVFIDSTFTPVVIKVPADQIDQIEFVNTEDGPGWLTHPIDTDRLRDYWTHGEGAAKIGWGTPGDFDRCRVNLAKYVKPQYLAGYCANRHYDALGFWPGRPVRGDSVSFNMNGVEIAEESEGLTLVASGEGRGVALVAAAPKADLPHEWFTDPGLDGPTALTISPEGRVFGHLATWGVCHIGIRDTCVQAPHSASGYAYFATGAVNTDKGLVPVGNISIGGGHAGERLGWRAATAHYDSTSVVVADIAIGEDTHGIWFSGAIRESISDDIIRELSASGGLSGDWREVMQNSGDLELVAALAVNVGGFPVPRIKVAASADRTTALVAAGIITNEDDPVDDLTEEIMARIEAKQAARQRHEALRSRFVGEKIAALRERLGKED